MMSSNNSIEFSGSEEFDLAYWDWMMSIGKHTDNDWTTLFE